MTCCDFGGVEDSRVRDSWKEYGDSGRLLVGRCRRGFDPGL